MKNKAIITAACVLILSGCSSARVDHQFSNEVPAERMFWEKARDESNGDSRVVVKRDSGAVYLACVSNIYFDGVRVAELYPNEKVTLYVNSGEHLIGEFLSGGGCAPFLKTIRADIKYNSFNVFRVKTQFLGANGGDALLRDHELP